MGSVKGKKGKVPPKRKAAKAAIPQVTRARDESKAPSVRERLEHISGLMQRLQWVRGKTAVELAELWGLSPKTVEGHAAECSRQITADPDEARRDITAACRQLLQETIADTKMSLVQRAQAAKAVGELWASVSGAKTAERHEIVTATCNPAEAARLVREKFGEKAMPKPTNGNTKP
jgi:uncharacterized membrane protein YccC